MKIQSWLKKYRNTLILLSGGFITIGLVAEYVFHLRSWLCGR